MPLPYMIEHIAKHIGKFEAICIFELLLKKPSYNPAATFDFAQHSEKYSDHSVHGERSTVIGRADCSSAEFDINHEGKLEQSVLA